MLKIIIDLSIAHGSLGMAVCGLFFKFFVALPAPLVCNYELQQQSNVEPFFQRVPDACYNVLGMNMSDFQNSDALILFGIILGFLGGVVIKMIKK